MTEQTQPTDAARAIRTRESLTSSRLQELTRYDHETGKLFWKITRGAAVKDRAAGSINNDGYLYLSVDGHKYSVHRLVWLYVYGEWPKKLVDHINRVKTDNRIANLREATSAENNQNTPVLKTNTSGYRGVCWCKRDSKWEAKIKHNKRTKFIGKFDCIEDAYQAYLDTAAMLHAFNPCVLSPSEGIKGADHA